jgi:O-antigen ligase
MDSSNVWLLAVGLLAVIVMAVLTASARRVVALGILLAFIPFQIVETRYSSSSVLMTYAMAATMLLLGGLRVRMLPSIGLVILAYLLSLTQAHEYLTLHVIEMFQYFSCFVVFLLAYNYARLVESVHSIIKLLLVMNVMVVIYCGLQLMAGAGNAFVPFGVRELAFNVNRDPSDPRLVGPFDNPGTTAGYFALMTIIWAATLLLESARWRKVLLFLIVANVSGIVATGNRASFLVLVAGLPALLFTFRKELGPKRFLQFLFGGTAALVLASATIAVYSGFGNMFQRLSSVTETEDGLPMTRAGTWSMAFDKISRHPWFGEGPHYFRAEDAESMGMLRATFSDLSDVHTVFDPYPHSLYLYLLRTVGIVGLAATLWFFLRVVLEMRRALRRYELDTHERTMLKVGVIVVGAFLVTQITLEFNRTATMDYAQFIFALMGFFVGVADRAAVPPSKASLVGASGPG